MKGGKALTGGAVASVPLLGLGALVLVGGVIAGATSDQQQAATAQLKKGAVPEAYAPLFEKYGNKCEAIDPPLLAAQVKAESGFNPKAVSPVGAQGLSQFMPATWDAHGVDGDGDGTADPWSPEDAVASQAEYDCYLIRLVKDVPGDPAENMLAAYNAGPYAVLEYQGVPPYEETEAYVTRILDYRDQLTAPVSEVVVAQNGGGRYQRVTYHGAEMDAYTAAALQAVEKSLGYDLVVTQGSYSTSVDASGGTHDGGGTVDIAVTGDPAEMVLALRAVGGFAAWHRTPDQGDWGEHIHAVQLGNARLSESARVQVVSYLRGDNGLVGETPDDGPRVQPVVFAWPPP